MYARFFFNLDRFVKLHVCQDRPAFIFFLEYYVVLYNSFFIFSTFDNNNSIFLIVMIFGVLCCIVSRSFYVHKNSASQSNIFIFRMLDNLFVIFSAGGVFSQKPRNMMLTI